jgi:lysozyme
MLTFKWKRDGWKVGLSILLLIGIFMAVYLGRQYQAETRFVRYPAFGISLPVGYSVHGIDVSKYQGFIHWQEVANMRVGTVQLRFAFMKATQGKSRVDHRFVRNWAEAKSAGILRGAYHFFEPGVDGRAQAEQFLANVSLEAGDLPPVLDVEQIGRTPVNQLQTRVAEWISVVEARYGVKPILYTNADFYTRYLAGRFDDYPLWVAHYFAPNRPRIGRLWSFWQHSETGQVSGIRGRVDFNVFNGSYAQLKSMTLR